MLGAVAALLVSGRVYHVVHRHVPPEMEQPDLIRWMDEAGRWINTLVQLEKAMVKACLV